MLTLELPHPPSLNHYWRRVGARTLISREGRRFRKHVVAILKELGCTTLHGPLAAEVEVFPPDRRRRDLDNVLKSLLDALEHGGAYCNDSQIVELHIRKCEVVPNGKVRVTLRPMENTTNDTSRLDCN
jgi:Holliday junction resolvase RusA-like endonuclease